MIGGTEAFGASVPFHFTHDAIAAMNLTVIQPRYKDLARINDLILASKRSWGYCQSLITRWTPELTFTENKLDQQLCWLAIGAEDCAVYFYSLRSLGAGHYELTDCWVAPEHKGKGVGAALFAHLTQQLSDHNGNCVRIVSDPHAEGFYLRMGAKRAGEIASEPEGRVLPVLELHL